MAQDNYRVVTTVDVFNPKGERITNDIQSREFVHLDNATTWRDLVLQVISAIYHMNRS